MQKQIKIFGLTISLVGMLFLGAGCSDLFNFTPKKQVNGVYKSEEGGINFVHKNVLSGNSNKNFVSSVGQIILSSDENKTLFARSRTGGVFRSEDNGDSWKNIFSGVDLVSMDVHPTDPKIIFVADVTKDGFTKVYRTKDGGENWLEVYGEVRKDNSIQVIKIDKASPNFVYIGFKGGEIIKSSDGGDKWEYMSNINRPVSFLEIHRTKPGVVYVAGRNKFSISEDGGRTFTPKRIYLDGQDQNGLKITSLAVNPNNNDEVYIGARDTIIYSNDGGLTWERIHILAKGENKEVYSLGVSLLNENKLVYVYYGVIYVSEDKGITWKTFNTTLPIRTVILDNQNGDIMYVGV